MGMTLKPREPKFEGMTVLKVGYINITEIDAFARKNKARKKGITHSSVTTFENMIKNGVYEPQYNIPPVVIKLPNGRYELVAGEHRLHAHIGQGKTEIWVAVVKFETPRSKSLYQSIENKLNSSFFETPRTKEDIVNSGITILKEEGFVGDNLPSSNYVWGVVNQLEISNEEAPKSSVHEAITNEIGLTKGDIQTFSAATGKKRAKEIHGNSDVPWTSALYKNVEGKTTDTDIRIIFQMLEKKEKNPALPFYVYGHWQKIGGEDLPTARKNKKKFWNEIEKKIVKYAKIIKSSNYVKPELKPIPQTEEDDE
jgi:hypothetical protein